MQQYLTGISNCSDMRVPEMLLGFQPVWDLSGFKRCLEIFSLLLFVSLWVWKRSPLQFPPLCCLLPKGIEGSKILINKLLSLAELSCVQGAQRKKKAHSLETFLAVARSYNCSFFLGAC